jgi:hypothetical protein
MKTSIYTVKPTWIGNPDKGQMSAPVKPKTFTANDLDQLRFIIRDFIGENGLGAGNWGTAKVFKNDYPLGYMSYNGRIWDRDIWSNQAKEIKDEI